MYEFVLTVDSVQFGEEIETGDSPTDTIYQFSPIPLSQLQHLLAFSYPLRPREPHHVLPIHPLRFHPRIFQIYTMLLQ